MMDIYTRLLMMDIMISAVAIMVNILENTQYFKNFNHI